MTFYLVVQKDTLENGRVKSIIRESQQSPEDFVNSLQDFSCYEFQLVAYTKFNAELEERVLKFSSVYKTNYGKDWYAFDGEGLAGVVSLFLEYASVTVNFNCMSSVFGYTLDLFPVVAKEINIVTLTRGEVSSSTSSVSSVCSLLPERTDEVREQKEQREVKEGGKDDPIISLIEKLEPTKSDLKKDKPSHKSKTGNKAKKN